MKTNRSTKAAAAVSNLFCDPERKYCDNYYCEAEAIKTVPVSVKQAGDSKRNFCGACYDAYMIGVQHGRLSENPNVYSRNGARGARLHKSGKI